MDRKEFLEKLGLGAAFVLTSTCLGGCGKDDGFLPDGPVDFTIDLTDAAYDNLNQNGGYIIKDQVVVARDDAGTLVAATQKCSHEGLNQIILKDNEWFCTAHDARYDLSGNGQNSKGSNDLTVYNVELTGTVLRVFSS